MIDYFYELQGILPGKQRNYGGIAQIVPAVCPFCGKSNGREFHSSYGPIFDGNYGYKCFSCGTAYSLPTLYAKLTGKEEHERSLPAVYLKPSPERAVPWWKKQADQLIKAYTGNEERYEAWARYKRLPPHVVDKYQLGIGVLPQSQYRDKRLIVPIVQNGKVVMLRGRRMSGDGPKWTSAGGVSPADIQLPFVEHVNKDIIFIVENPVDAIIIAEFSAASAVAALSTNYWYPHWTERLKELKPSIVVTAYDHDLAGEGVDVATMIRIARERISKIFSARGVTLEQVSITEVKSVAFGWRISWTSGEHRGILPIPAPAGVQRRNELLKAGIQVASMPWKDAADKCDIGDLWKEYEYEHA